MSRPPPKELHEPNQPPRSLARRLLPPISEPWLPAVGVLLLCVGLVICAVAPLIVFFAALPAMNWLILAGAAASLLVGVLVMMAGHALLNFPLRKRRREPKTQGFEVLSEHSDAGKP